MGWAKNIKSESKNRPIISFLSHSTQIFHFFDFQQISPKNVPIYWTLSSPRINIWIY